NGRMRSEVRNSDHTITSTWAVTNPISNYTIIPYIGKYVHWSEVYQGEAGKLDCDFWVLAYHEDSARAQFVQVRDMLKCFEFWFGPYPFYADGYKLIEAPHLGMEHQSAVAYGNKFRNGYLGRDLSGTGWGNKWDFIIVHESGHEWFGNNITSKDLADMWVHEGFTNYSETLFVDCMFGNEAGDDYVIGTRRSITNKTPITGSYGVNEEGSGDMYSKGGNMLHTIRHVINNDTLFRQILRGLNATFYHKTVTAAEIEQYINKKSGIDFSKIFEQYLDKTQIPELEYKVAGKKLAFRWTKAIEGFDLPLLYHAGIDGWLKPTTVWKTMRMPSGFDVTKFAVDRNFYVTSKMVTE
ncbi:MAG: M1 family aminopeptidase, partial [Chitinophagaceae bacterium]